MGKSVKKTNKKSNVKSKKIEKNSDNKFLLLISDVFEKIVSFIKKYWVILLIFLGVILIIIGIILGARYVSDKRKEQFLLSQFYDVYPEEIRGLYTNMVSVSCKGDLYLDIKIDSEPVLVNNLNGMVVLDYVFSYLDKNDLLSDSIDKKVINDAIDELFYTDIDILNSIADYQYGDYIYAYTNGKVIRKKVDECSIGDEERHYYSQLYGYSYNEELLSVDISIGYDKDGILYDLEGKELGEFEDEYDAQKLFAVSSYYRYNFVKIGGKYKLKSVEWMNRI